MPSEYIQIRKRKCAYRARAMKEDIGDYENNEGKTKHNGES